MKHLLWAFAALAVSGCVSPYVATPYERAAANVQQIALVNDAVPPRLTAWEVASAGSNFGLIGALADAGIQQSRENQLMETLSGAHFDAEAVIEARLMSSLTANGYEVALLENGDRERRVFLEKYEGGAEGVDAYLDVVVTNYGYIAAGMGQPWRPTADATVRLVSADGETLMENQIAYNSMYPRAGVITISPNPEYAFQNRDHMLQRPDLLAAGIEDALNQIADTSTRLLQ